MYIIKVKTEIFQMFILVKMYFTKSQNLIKSTFLGLQGVLVRAENILYTSKLLDQKMYFIQP